MNLDLKLIRHVLSLAKHRNFARAADALHISQPALSRSIARLEAALGVLLFDRTREGVVPTDYGRVLIERGGAIMNGAQELRREIGLMQGVEVGELSVAIGPFPHAISAGVALAKFMAAYPNVHVRLEQHSPKGTVVKLLEGTVDLGIADVREWHADARLEIQSLPQHVGIWACRGGHPLSGRPGLTLDDVLSYPLVCSQLPNQIATLFGDCPAAGRLDPDSGEFYPAVTLESLALGPGIVARSDAILLTSAGIAADGLVRGELAVLDLHLPWQRTNYGFLFKRGRTLSAATREFMECVRASESESMAHESCLLERYASGLRSFEQS